ncbi:DUF2513 domain-containing protein [Lichenifustis flavocetrariae]|uniref:DUF2513 domain-containing protein n=1 Tax=Lichenifustis flavocetrariae TaxID=2949735 RepID=A0AA41Z1U8_9HYPH|nr:DUF2513 domain-containing protein [Lichenifustis flavocetrariae]MCW6511308.1 DUF2513 domain-containing protein [Lichenifustis flavocetrariae]
MRRDPDLIRKLMLRLEELPIRRGGVVSIVPDDETEIVEGYTPAEIEYHLRQIDMAGFIIGDRDGRPAGGISFREFTPAGHDFLDAVRTPETWAKTKTAASRAGGFTLEILKDAAKAIARGELHKLGLAL